MRITTVTLVAATVAALAVVAMVLFIDPKVKEETDDADQPRTTAGASAAAQATLDLYTTGDYGDFWDSWSADSQGLISRADYLRMFELCKPPNQGLRFEVAAVTISGNTANVAVTRLLASFTYQFHYENGRWRYLPDAATREDYRSKTVEQIAAHLRAGKACA